MESKSINGRITLKHDIESNWLKAEKFIPWIGEIIIYDAENPDTDLTGTNRSSPILTSRIKIGDGVKNINDLPFANENIMKGTSENSFIANDLATNKVHSTNSTVFGENSTAGTKGYYIQSIEILKDENGITTGGNIYLSNSTDPVTPTRDNHQEDTNVVLPYTLGDGDSYFSVESNGYYHWIHVKKITAIRNNVISYEGIIEPANYWELGEPNNGQEQLPFCFFVESQPNDGIINFGNHSHAEGWYASALASQSHAEGYMTKAVGRYSHAEGFATLAGYAAHSEGGNTEATGLNSHAEGNSTVASGTRSHAEGETTVASGQYSHSEGRETQAIGVAAHTEGRGTVASGQYSHAEGFRTTAMGNFQHVQGIFNIEDSNNKYAHIVGNGTDKNNRSNAHTLDWEGNAWFAGNIKTVKNIEVDGEISSDTIYVTRTISADDSIYTSESLYASTDVHAAGNICADGDLRASCDIYADGDIYYKGEKVATKNYVDKSYTIAGKKSGTTLGSRATAEGYDTTASGTYSHTEGYGTTASGPAGHAEGVNTIAGERAHAEGNAAKANGKASHAENHETEANGVNSHAEGYGSKTNGNSSHAEGFYTEANGDASHAEGSHTVASGKLQHVQGQYNIADIIRDADGNAILDSEGKVQPANTYAHIVGNGTSETSRSNAHTLDWQGNAWYQGTITTGTSTAPHRGILIGTTEPNDSLGQDGDIYIMYV